MTFLRILYFGIYRHFRIKNFEKVFAWLAGILLHEKVMLSYMFDLFSLIWHLHMLLSVFIEKGFMHVIYIYYIFRLVKEILLAGLEAAWIFIVCHVAAIVVFCWYGYFILDLILDGGVLFIREEVDALLITSVYVHQRLLLAKFAAGAGIGFVERCAALWSGHSRLRLWAHSPVDQLLLLCLMDVIGRKPHFLIWRRLQALALQR